MKILINVFYINDFGGIVPCVENLALGMKRLDHDVQVVMSMPRRGYIRRGEPPAKRVEDGPFYHGRDAHAEFERGVGTGYWHRISLGWWDMPKLSYAEVAAIKCDLMVHMVPVPNPIKETRGCLDWEWLYHDSGAERQLVYIHDANFPRAYPHLVYYADRLHGAVCVHEAAYNSTTELPCPRVLIPNPHNVKVNLRDGSKPMRRRGLTMFSVQNFKRWKHVDDLVRAIPHLSSDLEVRVAGGGIEQRYISSTEKIKPEYLDEDGVPIWRRALDTNMTYLSFVTSAQRNEELAKARLLIDPSWSPTIIRYGCHFNRVMVEAMDMGAVPVCTEAAMRGSTLFEPGVNCLTYDHELSPAELAERLEDWTRDTRKLSRIQHDNRKLLDQFRPENIAHRVIEFSQEDPEDMADYECGAPKKKLLEAADRKMEKFYAD